MFKHLFALAVASASFLPHTLNAQCSDCGAAGVKLPQTSVVAAQRLNTVSTSSSYIQITLRNVPAGFDVSNKIYLGWCSDDSTATINAGTSARLYSSYDAALPATIQSPNWPKVNYVLNHKQGTYQDIQRAIWLVLRGTAAFFSDTPEVLAMVAAAQSAGPSYVPGAGETVAVIVFQDGFGGRQDTIIEVPVTPCASIGDVVFQDTDRDGIQDVDEPGIDGVSVRLFNNSGQLLGTQVTKVSGSQRGAYKFGGLCSGSYTVEVDSLTVPSGFITSPSEVGSDRSVDSNSIPAQVTLASREENLTVDFGYAPNCLATIGDLVWSDVNLNGIQDVGEPGLNGVKVRLLRGGVELSSATTIDGVYGFSGLCTGNYQVEVDATTLPAGFTPTTSSAAGSSVSTDSDGSPATVIVDNPTASINTIDFGYVPPCTATAGDFVWFDANRNGVQDLGEAGLNGVSVLLKNAAGTVLGSTATAQNSSTGLNGYYQFSGLCRGSYTVEVDPSTVPAGFTKTGEAGAGSTVETDSNASPAAFSFATNSGSATGLDFGFVAPCTAGLGNFVWFDLNRNGVQDSHEFGLHGLVVNLRNPANNALLATTTTSITGSYSLAGLCEGSYKLEVVPPSVMTSTVVSGSGSTSETDSNSNPSPVLLPLYNSSDLTIDFGLVTKTTKTCALTQGYWKNHEEKWPVTTMVIGSQIYTQTELLDIFRTSVRGDDSVALAYQLIAAKLNLFAGSSPSTVLPWVSGADALLATYPGKLPFKALNNSLREKATNLDNYNNGRFPGMTHCN